MNPRALKLDWCSREAAKYAIMHWHYSRAMPVGKLACIGVWERTRFIGAVIYGRGATPQVAKHFNVKQTQMAELVRVALSDHETPVSRIVAISLKILKRQSPGLDFIISFADDTNQGHKGTIYQAGNWVYLGISKSKWILVNGKEIHPRTYRGCGKKKKPLLTEVKVKHRYVYPFSKEFKKAFALQSQPYPKRAGSVPGSTADAQSERGGSIPTPALIASDRGKQNN